MATELILRLAGDEYQVLVSPPIQAVQLRRFGCRSYTVSTRDGRVVCSCPDFVHRQAATPSGRCKHGEAVVSVGLLSPHVAAEPEPEEPESSIQA